MSKTISVRKLIFIIFGTMLAFSVTLLVVVNKMRLNQQELIAGQEQRFRSYLLADELRQSSEDLTRFARTYVVTGDERYKQYYEEVVAIRSGQQPRPQDYNRIYWDFKIANGQSPTPAGQAKSLTDMMREEGFTQRELDKLSQAQANSEVLVKTETRAMNAVGAAQQGVALNTSSRAESPAELLHDQRYHQEKAKIMEPINDFFVMLDDRTRTRVEQDIAAGHSLFNVLMGLAASLIAFSLLLAWALMRLVLKPLGAEPTEMAYIARRIADRDLTVEFSKTTPLQGVYGAMQEMTSELRGIVGNIMQSSSGLAAAAEETSTVTEQTSANAQRQQLETDQVAAAMNEMSSTVQNVAQSTTDAAEAAHSARSAALEGKKVVQDTAHVIQGLVDEVDKASSVIVSLKSDSEKIGTVIEVIRSIAARTNLLALNAAIEAARAGAHGRGFSVVADEVRALAEQTQSSTQEIEDIIQQLHSGTQQAVSVMGSSQTQANMTLEKADEALKALESITDAINIINDVNTQVASAAEQQVAVTEEINRNITNISRASEETAVGAKQTAASSTELSRLAEQLQTMIAEFKVQ